METLRGSQRELKIFETAEVCNYTELMKSTNSLAKGETFTYMCMYV